MGRGLSILVALLPIFFALGFVSGQDSKWSELEPLSMPSTRLGHDMAYDSESDRVILFGGERTFIRDDTVNDETWGYDLNSNTWQNLDPSPRPGSRFGHAMAYDVESDRIILYGGLFASAPETWAYNFNANAWTNMNPAISPTAWGLVEMAYDVGSDRIVLFGGISANSRFASQAAHSDETWAYNFNANAWTRLNPGLAPSPRAVHGMAYDTESDRVVLFGGGDGQVFGDTWAYDFDNDTWTQMNPATAPSSRFAAALAYDAESDRVMLFGGSSGRNETWVYDLNRDQWTLAERGSGPSSRFGAALAYDTESDRIMLFGGSFGGDETWVYTAVPPAPDLPAPDLVPILLAVAVAGGVGVALGAYWVRRTRSKRRGGKEGA